MKRVMIVFYLFCDKKVFGNTYHYAKISIIH